MTLLDRFNGHRGAVSSCVCGAGGGVVLSHIGCAVSYALTFSGVGLAAGFSASSAALGVSAATTSAGLGLWYSLRGKVADRFEKRLTIVSAIAGAAVSLVLHFNGAVGHISSAEKSLEFYRSQTPQAQNELQEASGSQSIMEFLTSICGSPPKP